MNDFDNRIVDNIELHCKFHSKKGYQKLGDKCELKEIRGMGWLKNATFLKSIYDDCWNARYSMR